MIRRWLWSALTQTLPPAGELGFVVEQSRYCARHDRNVTAWGPHLDKTRAFITRSIGSARDYGLAVVAGSGPCLDVPLEELSRSFRQVLLLDVAHPRSVLKKASRLGNVQCVLADLTGVLEATLEASRFPRPLPTPPCPPVLPVKERPGLVISVNTLSQLPLLPLDKLWLTGRYTDAQVESFARGLIEGHMAWLESFDAPRCLITDVAWLAVHDCDVLSADPLHGVAPPPPDERWEWRVAPCPEAHPVRDVVHVVGASLVRP